MTSHAMKIESQRELKELPGNQHCVDCGAPQPSWASISFGTLMCLECSGQHRSYGVHISFVRSVTMDAWSEKQLRAMSVGGNAKLNDFFKKHGADKLPVRQRYHSAAAAMYRDIVVALRDGKTPPTDIAPYQAELDAEARGKSGGGGSTPSDFGGSSGGGGKAADRSGESPVERELRLRAEAQERLRAKFGTGGLKAQSVNNTPTYATTGISGPTSSSGGGSPGGGGGNSADEIFGVDLAAANQRMQAFAGSAFSRLSEVAMVTGHKVAEGTQSLSKKVQEAHVGEKLSGAVNSVSAAVSDPNLLNNVSKGASSFWSKASVVGSGLWMQAAATAKTLAADLGAATGVPPRHSGFAEFGEEGDSSAPRAGAGGSGNGRARLPSGDASAADGIASGGRPGKQQQQQQPFPPSGAAPAPSPPALDDDAWLAQQVTAVSTRSAAGSRGGPKQTPSPVPAASADEWSVDNWDAHNSNNSGAAAAPAVPSAGSPPNQTASQKQISAMTQDMGSVRVADAVAVPTAAAGAAPSGEDDDFFASFGLK